MYATEILPNLWIGDKRSPTMTAFKRKHNIGLVVNCTRSIPLYKGEHKNIRIPVDDDLTDESRMLLFHYIPSIVELIGKYIRDRQGVLVHCHAGCQRSATVVAAYIMLQTGFEPELTVKLIRTKRSLCFTPGVKFHTTLRLWKKSISESSNLKFSSIPIMSSSLLAGSSSQE